jgi:hypothetical protein
MTNSIYKDFIVSPFYKHNSNEQIMNEEIKIKNKPFFYESNQILVNKSSSIPNESDEIIKEMIN